MDLHKIEIIYLGRPFCLKLNIRSITSMRSLGNGHGERRYTWLWVPRSDKQRRLTFCPRQGIRAHYSICTSSHRYPHIYYSAYNSQNGVLVDKGLNVERRPKLRNSFCSSVLYPCVGQFHLLWTFRHDKFFSHLNLFSLGIHGYLYIAFGVWSIFFAESRSLMLLILSLFSSYLTI